MILKVIKYCPLHWLQLEVARIQVVFWCLSESKISYTGFMIINQLRESWLPLLLCKLVCNEWAVNDAKEKINQSFCGELLYCGAGLYAVKDNHRHRVWFFFLEPRCWSTVHPVMQTTLLTSVNWNLAIPPLSPLLLPSWQTVMSPTICPPAPGSLKP